MKKLFSSVSGVFIFNIAMCAIWYLLIYFQFNNWNRTAMTVSVLTIIPMVLTIGNLFMWMIMHKLSVKHQQVEKKSSSKRQWTDQIKYYYYGFFIWLLIGSFSLYGLWTIEY
jgi:hypothetical protein